MITSIKEIIPTKKTDQEQPEKIINSNPRSLNDLKWSFQNYVNQNYKNYKIDNENRDTITDLLLYFSGKEEFEQSVRIKNPSLDKGILLAGNIGSGKTTLMRILKDLRISPIPFQSKSCREISQLYVLNGIEAIQNYGIKAVKFHNGKCKMRNNLFDDLGTERNMSFYGNKLNVMEEILMDRYDHFVNHGLITHLTTNLTLDEIRETYGDRLESRIHEMFNIVILGGSKESKDRRIINKQ